MRCLLPLHSSVCSIPLLSQRNEQILVILFIYHPSLQVKAANTQQGRKLTAMSLHFSYRVKAELWTDISGGHLHTCECLNRSVLDTEGRRWGQQTIQLCKHAATSFPPVLKGPHWDKPLFKQHTQHSCAWSPASCCILNAGLPACLSRDRHRPYTGKGHPQQTKGFYTHAGLDSSPEPCNGYCQ